MTRRHARLLARLLRRIVAKTARDTGYMLAVETAGPDWSARSRGLALEDGREVAYRVQVTGAQVRRHGPLYTC